ncbi:MAG: HAMP domain-containing sensor histidine kinase [Bacteroidota bacterium]
MKYLYWKISAALLGLFIVLGLVFVGLTGYFTKEYLQESNQMLYGSIAAKMIKEVKPLVDGQVDTMAIQKIMDSKMVINPSIEIYLLDTEGKIITYVAPESKIKADRVDLEPVREKINAEEFKFIKGDDPRFPEVKNVFSAAPITENGELQGYLYIILASEEQSSVLNYLVNCKVPKIGISIFTGALLMALILSFLAIWFVTKNLRRYVETVTQFKEGDLSIRVGEDAKGDFPVLADTFNEMADTIVANIDELKSVENLRRELIANVSHDLRTPLAIMQGYVETLLMKADKISSLDRQKYLNIILRSSEKLSDLIKQLFEYSKLEARQIEPQKEPFQMTDLVADAFARYQVLAKEKDITVKVEHEENLPIVFADVSLVERVIQNLMDNALKFTPNGGTVTIGLEEQKGGVQIKVQDTGPGIPSEEQAFIFDRYRKTSTTTTAKNTGAGLGLAIVKKILELHDASIRVQSQLNGGTSFIFSLPTYGKSTA